MKAYTHQQLWDLLDTWRGQVCDDWQTCSQCREIAECAYELQELIGERDTATNA